MAIHAFIWIKFRIIHWLKRNKGISITMAFLAYHLLVSENLQWDAMQWELSLSLFTPPLFLFFHSSFISGILGWKFQVLYYRSGSILNYFFTE